MNPELTPLFSRRSIRAYKPDTIPEEMITDLLQAAMAAPSAVARDPWEFLVVQNKQTLEKISAALPNGKFLADAPLGIVVCGNLRQAHDGQISYLLQDCASAVENMLLAAGMLGLGACWLGVHPRDERVQHLRTQFSLPEHIIPVATIAIGHPDEEKEPRTRYDDKSVHWEKW